ncbi:NAD-dependent epimerase/dehydratase family protein [Solimonas sp. K1W22B-7]|uniref:NAD-dependent epimerase/dehydratase family protein n=1 Tax=Solimonas sp. K1W22B-7 TaxID=2303331 RepID=UPI000E330697|nr:NAD-dependent epimerase/dehydratase family protein [Solimonas sp. K1W22B-7]AXQ28888.1 NAD-dependent epimerase/dehydratase family protein [Solimonas sp. K1W22B-7]
MNILVLGGTGLIGGDAALHLASLGHQVTLAARKPAAVAEGSPLSKLPFLQIDYLADAEIPALASFDTLVFAAGNDIRHVPPGTDESEHWQRANVEGVPRFFARARDAGIRRAVYIGSFYPQVRPDLVEKSTYVRGRKLADEGARALAGDRFQVCSVNAPFVAGHVPGLVVPGLAAHAAYALGRIPQVPVFAMPGGVNFISTTSLSEAVAGALLRGENGKAYLVGDENLSFQDYFGEYFRAAGRSGQLALIDREHPMLPDVVLYAGRGGTIYYEPDAAETRLLGYRRGDVKRTLHEIVEGYR